MKENILNFNNSEDWLLLKKYCRNNFINQIDFFRYEDMHTNFLKSLFESNNVYGLTIYPLKKFIELIKMKDETKFKEINIFDDYDISHVKIESQKQINNYRLDLFIQFEINDKPYIIVLENKLFSSENNEQCLKYEITCQEALKDKNEIIFVYLSLSNDSKISSNNYVRINYQELISNVIEPCSYIENNFQALNVKEYLKSYVYLYNLDFGNSEKNIPLTREIEKLVMNIYNDKNFQVILNADSTDRTYEQFLKANTRILDVLFIALFKLEKITDNKYNQLKINLKNSRKTHCFNDKPLYNTDLFYEVIQYLIKNDFIEDSNKLEKLTIFNNLRYLVSDLEKLTEEEQKYRDIYRKNKENQAPIIFDGKEYYYWTFFSEDYIQEFIDRIKAEYPEINIY